MGKKKDKKAAPRRTPVRGITDDGRHFMESEGEFTLRREQYRQYERDRKKRRRQGEAVSERDTFTPGTMSRTDRQGATVGHNSGTAGHTKKSRQMSRSTSQPIKREPFTIGGIEMGDMPAPKRRDLQPLRLVHDVDSDEQKLPPSTVQKLPQNVPLNVPLAVGGGWGSPPLGGGDPTTGIRLSGRDKSLETNHRETRISNHSQAYDNIGHRRFNDPAMIIANAGTNGGTLDGTLRDKSLTRGTSGTATIDGTGQDGEPPRPAWVDEVFERIDQMREQITEARAVVYEGYRRSEQGATMIGRMRKDLDDFKQFVLGLRAKQRPPPPYPDVACVNTLREVLAAEEAKAALLEKGFSDDHGPQPLDLAALDEADARIDRAVEHYNLAKKMARAARTPSGPATVAEPKRDETPSEDLTLGAALVRTFQLMMQRVVSRDRWTDLPWIDEPQKAALKEIYRLAVDVANGDGERAFAIFAKWCEMCSLDAADPFTTATPEFLLKTPELRLAKVDIGPEDTWWTPERVKEAWTRQIAT